MDFSIRYFKPGYTGRCSTVGPGHTTGIEKKNVAASFISRDVRVAVQENIDAIWWLLGWNVLKAKFQSTARKIDDQGPVKIAVTVSPHKHDARSDGPQLIENRFRANVAQMPDFVAIFSHFFHSLG